MEPMPPQRATGTQKRRKEHAKAMFKKDAAAAVDHLNSTSFSSAEWEDYIGSIPFLVDPDIVDIH